MGKFLFTNFEDKCNCFLNFPEKKHFSFYGISPILSLKNNRVIGVLFGNDCFSILINPINEFIKEYNKTNNNTIINSNIIKKEIKIKITIKEYDIYEDKYKFLYDKLKNINEKEVDFYID